jgi:hypothetical protein
MRAHKPARKGDQEAIAMDDLITGLKEASARIQDLLVRL